MRTQTPSLVAAIAVYGALLSTYGALLSTLNFLRDRVKVKVSFSKDLRSTGAQRDGKLYTDVHVVNHGKRPTTIMSIGYLSFSRGRQLLDTEPKLPFLLTDGQPICALMDQSKSDPEDVVYFFAWDARGRYFRKFVASPRRLVEGAYEMVLRRKGRQWSK
jgi:hypothetical protein